MRASAGLPEASLSGCNVAPRKASPVRSGNKYNGRVHHHEYPGPAARAYAPAGVRDLKRTGPPKGGSHGSSQSS